jgi:hypothetical protein
MNPIEIFMSVLTRPEVFFKRIKKDESILAPWLYYMLMMGIFCFVYMIFLLLNPTIPEMSSGEQTFYPIFVVIIMAVMFVSSLGGIFISVGIMHLFLLMVGTKKSYVQTFKMMCYTYGLFLLVVPAFFLMLLPEGPLLIIGVMALILICLAIMVYSYTIMVKGTVILHEITPWRAVIALVIIPLAIALIIMAFVFLFMLFVYMAAKGSGAAF